MDSRLGTYPSIPSFSSYNVLYKFLFAPLHAGKILHIRLLLIAYISKVSVSVLSYFNTILGTH